MVIQEKLGAKEGIVELKPFSGLKLCSKTIPAKNFRSNLHNQGYINSDYIIQLSAEFTNNFKRKLRKLHNIE